MLDLYYRNRRLLVVTLLSQFERVSAAIVKSLWPVPERALTAALAGVRRCVVAELNLGQYRREVERIAGGVEVVGVHRVDGQLIAPAELEEAAS